MAVKTSRLGLALQIGLIVFGLAAAALIAFSLVRAAFPETSEFRFRIELSPQRVLWVHLKGRRVEAALAADGKQPGAWQNLGGGERALPGAPRVYLSKRGQGKRRSEGIYLSPAMGRCSIEWRLEKTDQSGARWVYVCTASVPASSPGSGPAPMLSSPELDPPELHVGVEANPVEAGTRLGIWLEVSSHDFVLTDIQKDGHSVSAQVRVRGDDGRVLAKRIGPLSSFGFT